VSSAACANSSPTRSAARWSTSGSWSPSTCVWAPGTFCAGGWDAHHLARDVFLGLDGDIRVCGDTVVITYYNAPDAHRLRGHYEGLPGILEHEGTAPQVPWLYGLKLDFRFR